MTDLMYFGYDWEDGNKELETTFIEQIKGAFPQVILRDAYDSIKGYRQEVVLPDEEKDNYYTWLMANGWWNLSMHLQLTKMDNIG